MTAMAANRLSCVLSEFAETEWSLSAVPTGGKGIRELLLPGVGESVGGRLLGQRDLV
jgi:hypothetical protein